MGIIKNKRFSNLFMLSALSYFKEDDGFCYFSKKGLIETFCYSKKDIVSSNLKHLQNIGLIENHTVNGYYNKIKILDDSIVCYDFMLNKDLTIYQRGFLYAIKDLDVPYGKNKYPIKYISRNLSTEIKHTESYLSRIRKIINIEDSLLNKKIAHGIIKTDAGNLVKNECGYRLSFKELKVCKYCGETNQESFFYLTKNVCNKCIGSYSIARDESYADLLYKNSKSSRKNKIFNYTLTKEYIIEVLKSQNGRCAYSGMEFSLHDKRSAPTIDRIDSSKGYEIGNIAIVRLDVNIMKSNLSFSDFKILIDNLFHNLQ